jgi:hypothetical protein
MTAGDPRVTGIDALSRTGAHELAERIIQYWELRAYRPPKVWIEQIEGMTSVFIVRSDMVCGFPQGA